MKLAYDRDTGWGIQLSDFASHCLREDKIPISPNPFSASMVSRYPPTHGGGVHGEYVHPAFRTFVIPTPDIRKRVT